MAAIARTTFTPTDSPPRNLVVLNQDDVAGVTWKGILGKVEPKAESVVFAYFSLDRGNVAGSDVTQGHHEIEIVAGLDNLADQRSLRSQS